MKAIKEETLEEAALKWFVTTNKREIIFDLGWIKIFEAGANWQQERMYSEEDMQSLIKIRNYFGENDNTSFEHFAYSFLDGIIKQFKNK